MSGTDDPHFDSALDEWRAGRAPNPRPVKRQVNRDAGREKCLGLGAECRLCGRRTGLQRHHLVPKGQRGDDVDENLVPLCLDCHKRITENDAEALSLLRGRLWPEEEVYVAHKRGWDWLERRYPSGADGEPRS